jgi:hypothetical protein
MTSIGLNHPHPTHILYTIPGFIGYIIVEHAVKSSWKTYFVRHKEKVTAAVEDYLPPKGKDWWLLPPWSKPSEYANYISCTANFRYVCKEAPFWDQAFEHTL